MKAHLVFSLIALALAAGPAAAEDQEAIVREQLPSYPLTTCVVSNEPLDANGEPLDHVHEGRLVRLCCKGCLKELQKDPAAVLAKIDAAVVAQQKQSYPLTTCPVSGEELGAMGEPIDYVHGTRLVRMCCKGCIKGFQKDPAKVMATVDEALIRAQRPSYPLDTCLVSGEPLDAMGEPLDMLYGTRLVRLCCKGCKKAFYKDAAALVAKLDAAEPKSM